MPFAIQDHGPYTGRVPPGPRFSPARGSTSRALCPRSGGSEGPRDRPGRLRRRGEHLPPSGRRSRGVDFWSPCEGARKAACRTWVERGLGFTLAAPTLKTTNDMPIVQPQGFHALGLVPFQINAHYFDADPASIHMGETREERLLPVPRGKRDAPWSGCAKGAWLSVRGPAVRVEGKAGGAASSAAAVVAEERATGGRARRPPDRTLSAAASVPARRPRAPRCGR